MHYICILKSPEEHFIQMFTEMFYGTEDNYVLCSSLYYSSKSWGLEIFFLSVFFYGLKCRNIITIEFFFYILIYFKKYLNLVM